MTARFAKRVAVVTGASSGIGRAIAVALGTEGASVVLGGRSAGLLEEVAEEIRAAGSRAISSVMDVRRERDMRALIASARNAFGGLDVMVNDAAVDHPSAIVDGETERWREMLETNALAVFVGCREAVRAMGARGGTIVNISSLAGSEPTPGDAVYSATKHAVEAFTRSLRAELEGSRIRLLVVAPGQVMTSIGRNLPHESLRAIGSALGIDPTRVPDFHGGHVPPEFAAEVLRSSPDRFLAPEEVARVTIEALAARDGAPFRIAIRPEDRPRPNPG